MNHLAIQLEDFADVIDEAQPLLMRHWAEIALDKDEVPLDPDRAKYDALNRMGQLSVMTVRSKGALVGYSCMIINPGLHNKSTLQARMDIFYLAPEFRGRLGGFRLLKAHEAHLKKRGVRRIFMGSKLHKDIARLFEACSYREIERWYSKLL